MTEGGLRLIADIGGTNARFALAGDDGKPRDIRRIATADHEWFAGALGAYLADRRDLQIGSAAIAIAGPVTNGAGRLVNGPWQFDSAAIAAQLGGVPVILLNDLEAAAHGVLAGAAVEPVIGGRPVEGAPVMVIGIGTGVGGALAVPDGDGGRMVIATEIGHQLLPPLPRPLHTGNDDPPCSAEELLSGSGMPRLYRLCGGNAPSPEAVVAALGDGSPASALFVETYATLLGRFAANAALGAGARGGVVFVGGMLPRLGHWLDRSLLADAFVGGGAMREWLAAIPVGIVADDTVALCGLAALR